MTQAEKMAEEWGEKFKFEYPTRQKKELKQFIQQVAERTREECKKAYEAEATVTEWEIVRAIRNARWEDEEA